MVPAFFWLWFWLQPSRSHRDCCLPLHHGLPRSFNGQLRGGEISLEAGQVVRSRPLLDACRPHGHCCGGKSWVSYVYWKRRGIQVSEAASEIWLMGTLRQVALSFVKSKIVAWVSRVARAAWVAWVVSEPFTWIDGVILKRCSGWKGKVS